MSARQLTDLEILEVLAYADIDKEKVLIIGSENAKLAAVFQDCVGESMVVQLGPKPVSCIDVCSRLVTDLDRSRRPAHSATGPSLYKEIICVRGHHYSRRLISADLSCSSGSDSWSR